MTEITELSKVDTQPKVIQPDPQIEEVEEPQGPYFEPPKNVSTKEEQQDLKSLFAKNLNAEKKDNSTTELIGQNDSFDKDDIIHQPSKSATPDIAQKR